MEEIERLHINLTIAETNFFMISHFSRSCSWKDAGKYIVSIPESKVAQALITPMPLARSVLPYLIPPLPYCCFTLPCFNPERTAEMTWNPFIDCKDRMCNMCSIQLKLIFFFLSLAYGLLPIHSKSQTTIANLLAV